MAAVVRHRDYGVAVVLMFWTLRRPGPNLTDTVVTRKIHTLGVTVHKRVRHPFYDAAALLLIAISLVAAKWFMFATGPPCSRCCRSGLCEKRAG